MMKKNYSRAVCLFTSTLIASTLIWTDLSVAQIDGNQSIGSGSWFNFENWENQFGDNEAPDGNDGFDVHISGDHVIGIGNGDAEVDDDLIVGDAEDGVAGNGELNIFGTGSLSVGNNFLVSGEFNNILNIDTAGTINVGQNLGIGTLVGLAGGDFAPAPSTFNFSNGTINTRTFGLGLGNADMTGGILNVTANGLAAGIGRNGVFDQSGGLIDVRDGSFEVTGIYNLSGNGAADVGGNFIVNDGVFNLSDNGQLTSEGFIVGNPLLAFANISDNAIVDVTTVIVGDLGGRGTVDMSGGLMSAEFVTVGRGAADSFFNLSGGRVTTANQTVIGRSSNGELQMTNDSIWDGGSTLFVGNDRGTEGHVTLEQDAAMNVGQFQLGVDGLGTMTLFDVTQLAVDRTFIGVQENGTGTLSMFDRSILMSGSRVTVGQAGEGELLMIDNSLAQLESLRLAAENGSSGIVSLSENARLETVGSLLMASNGNEGRSTLTIDDNAVMSIGGNSFAGGSSGNATVDIGMNVQGGRLEIAGDANFGGSRSTSIVNVGSGLLQANNLLFDGVDPDNTNNVLNLFDGKVQGLTNVEFQRGIEANISGGELVSGEDMVFGNDASQDGTSVLINQTGGFVDVGQDFRLLESSRVRYQLDQGAINIGRNALLGSAENAIAVWEQNGGQVNVEGEVLAEDAFHFVNGGSLNVEGNYTAIADADASPIFELNDGDANILGDFRYGSGRATVNGGLLDVSNNLIVGSSAIDTEADFQIAGGLVNATKLIVDSTDAGLSVVNLDGGRIVVDEVDINGTSSVFQFGGNLETNLIAVDDDGTYFLVAGSLQSKDGPLSIEGDITMGLVGELLIENTGDFEVQGAFESVDLEAAFGQEDVLFQGGGVLNLLNLDLDSELAGFENGEGYFSLFDVGDVSNLLTGDALDDVQLLQNLQGNRLTELDFNTGLNGNSLAGFSFALVEGTNFGSANTVGIAFSNFNSVPEPSSAWLLVGIACWGISRRRRQSA